MLEIDEIMTKETAPQKAQESTVERFVVRLLFEIGKSPEYTFDKRDLFAMVEGVYKEVC